MDAVITLLGVLGIGALLISVYVFAMAARRFVADEEPERHLYEEPHPSDDEAGSDYGAASNDDSWMPRSGQDRRQNDAPVVFPITVNGEMISRERRQGERRRRRA